MQHIFKGFNDQYASVFRNALIEIVSNGKEVSPRGNLTKEISPATLIVDPKTTLYLSKTRNLNFAFLFAENLWYLSGRADTSFLSFYNSKIKSFSEDGLHDGAYGPEILSQIRYVVDTLTQDKDSRQAIISLWRKNPKPSKDVPCTSLFQFMIRDDKLNMYVTMRSNDIIWGSNYDVPSFALIQLVIASCLGVEPGLLYHTANSLHLYDTHFELAQTLCLEEMKYSVPLKTCMDMRLEGHVQQWDILSSIEGQMRNLQGFNVCLVLQIQNKLDLFYQQYAFVFGWYHAFKKKDIDMMDVAVRELYSIGSPLTDWYKEKTEELKNK